MPYCHLKHSAMMESRVTDSTRTASLRTSMLRLVIHLQALRVITVLQIEDKGNIEVGKKRQSTAQPLTQKRP